MTENTLPVQELDQGIVKARQYLALLKEIHLQQAAVDKKLPARYTPEQVAGMYNVVPSTVLRWIRQGHLGALDLTPDGSRRRVYAIREEDLVAFESVRSTLNTGKKKKATA